MPTSIDFKHNMAKLQGPVSGEETTGECENKALEGGKGPGTNPALGNPGKGAGKNMSNAPTSGGHKMSKVQY